MADPYVSLASATSTSIDSAAKHNLQCRMYTELIQSWVGSSDVNSAEILKRDKMNYCMHKDEIAVGCRDAWYPDSLTMPPRPYPLIFTTYASMQPDTKKFLRELYHTVTNADQLDHFLQRHKEKASEEIRMLPQFYFQGISLGVAYAHPDSGDTVGTVMYGGLRTILNGHFNAQNGQPCMWYFDFEFDLFDPQGKRVKDDNGTDGVPGDDDEADFFKYDAKTLNRKRFHARELGQVRDNPGKRGIIMVKPYVRSYPEKMLDKDRVFGKYISTGRPFEKIDLQISRLAV